MEAGNAAPTAGADHGTIVGIASAACALVAFAGIAVTRVRSKRHAAATGSAAGSEVVDASANIGNAL
jgi:hypothetical protein